MTSNEGFLILLLFYSLLQKDEKLRHRSFLVSINSKRCTARKLHSTTETFELHGSLLLL